jgi:hypothetical protein
MSLVERSFRASDITPARGRQMIDWCIDRGGDQFSFSIIGIDSPDSHQPLLDDLASFYDGKYERENTTAYGGDAMRRATDTWRLSTASVAALGQHVPDGVFAEPPSSANWWVEDFTVYRRGDILFGVVSHEDYVFERLSDPEMTAFSKSVMPLDETTI